MNACCHSSSSDYLILDSDRQDTDLKKLAKTSPMNENVLCSITFLCLIFVIEFTGYVKSFGPDP